MEAPSRHLEQLDASGNQVIADGVERQLDPRYIPLQRVVGQIVTACLSIGALIGVIVSALSASLALVWVLLLLVLWLVATIGLAWVSHRWPEWEYQRTSYRVDSQGMEIKTGVFWRHVINVPRSRVQHTDVTQGPLQRRYGLGTLLIHTAGTEHAEVTLPGLAHETALQIRDHLLPRADPDAV